MNDELVFSTQGLGALNVALALIVFSVALHLSGEQARLLLRQPRVALAGLAAQWLLLPALTLGLILLLQPPPAYAAGMLLVAACPGGAVSGYFTVVGRGNAVLSVALTSASTLAAAVSTPLLFVVGMHLAGFGAAETSSGAPTPAAGLDVPVTAMLALLGWTVALPLAVGVALLWRAPRLVARLRGPSRLLAGLLLAAIILAGLHGNRGLLLDTGLAPMLGLVALHNAAAFAGGRLVAGLARCAPAEARTVTLETGIQNAGLGLVLIFNFYPDEDAMTLLVATWGVWHLLAGAALARWWRWRDG